MRFEEFWQAYPHRGGAGSGRAAAQDAYARALERGVPENTLVNGAMRFRQDRRAVDGFAPDPHRWIDGRGWEDDLEPPRHARAVVGATIHRFAPRDPPDRSVLDRLRKEMGDDE